MVVQSPVLYIQLCGDRHIDKPRSYDDQLRRGGSLINGGSL